VLRLLFSALSAISTSVLSADLQTESAPLLTEVLARFNAGTGRWPDPATLVLQVRQGDEGLLARLASPIDAQLLAEPRISQHLLAELSVDDPRVMLHAKARDVVFVASAGNHYSSGLYFPAIDTDTVAVGGLKSGGYFWDNGNPSTGCDPTTQVGDNCGSNWGTQQNIETLAGGSSIVVGPAMTVVSTFYDAKTWNADIYCGDTYGQNASNANPSSGGGGIGSGYGDCSGTSMAAPHVSGIAGLVRSANPLLTAAQVKSILGDVRNTTPCVGSDSRCGSGVPDAVRATQAGLGGSVVMNRLTPLFSFYSGTRADHLYTIFPQVGAAALLGAIRPLSYTGNYTTYYAIGPTTSALGWFPGVSTSLCTFSPPCSGLYPAAMVSVFTTHKNPYPGQGDLAPLYRYSWPCPGASDPNCTNNEHTSHVYSTSLSENWPAAGYRLDGIEGYVYPKSMAQPPGTVKLCRTYYEDDDDYILYPGTGTNGTDCTAHTDEYTPGGANYTENVNDDNWIGWVHPASKVGPVYAIDRLMQVLDDE
jgi:hypothetical protein